MLARQSITTQQPPPRHRCKTPTPGDNPISISPLPLTETNDDNYRRRYNAVVESHGGFDKLYEGDAIFLLLDELDALSDDDDID